MNLPKSSDPNTIWCPQSRRRDNHEHSHYHYVHLLKYAESKRTFYSHSSFPKRLWVAATDGGCVENSSRHSFKNEKSGNRLEPVFSLSLSSSSSPSRNTTIPLPSSSLKLINYSPSTISRKNGPLFSHLQWRHWSKPHHHPSPGEEETRWRHQELHDVVRNYMTSPLSSNLISSAWEFKYL